MALHPTQIEFYGSIKGVQLTSEGGGVAQILQAKLSERFFFKS